MEKPTPRRLVVAELDYKGNVLHIPDAESTLVAPSYLNRRVLYSVPAWLDAGGRPGVLKHPLSETDILQWASKWPKTMNEMMHSQVKEADDDEVKT